MPKVGRDEELAVRVASIISERGSVSAAAAALGVNRTLLWRFKETGRAIERTRLALAEALVKHEKETPMAESATSSVFANPPTGVPVADLIAMRAFFQNMLNLIDAYVSNPANSAGMVELARSAATSKHTSLENESMTGRQNG